MSPASMHNIKTSKKITVVSRIAGDMKIAMEGVPIALLKTYTGLAKTDGENNRLVINGKRSPVQWILHYMAAGEKDGGLAKKLSQFAISDLCDVYKTAEYLDYTSLMNRVDRIMHSRIHLELLGEADIEGIYDVFPHLQDAVIKHVVQLMLVPKVMNYQPYTELVFKHELDQAVQQHLKHRIECGEKYYAARAAQKKQSGYKKNFKSQTIDVISNGGGLRTCDREVRNGEKTRTGLVI